MDIALYRSVLEPVVTFFVALVASGVTTTVAVQILKLPLFGKIAAKYPRFSTAVVAFLATLVAVYNSTLELVITNGWQVAAFAAGVFIVAVVTYNNAFKAGSSLESTRL